MLSTRFSQNIISKYRTVFRFQNQNIDWTFKDLDYFSETFLSGLQENKIPQKSTIVTWLDEKHSSENVASIIGSLKNGNKIVSLSKLFNASKINPESIREALIEINPSLLLVSPNQSINGVSKADLITQTFPETQEFGKNGYLKLKEVNNLRFLVQTGFYAKPGFVKFRDFCVYAPPSMRKLVKSDFSGDLDFLSEKVKSWPEINSKDHVYMLSGFDNIDLVLKAIYETGAVGNFLDFVPEETVHKSDWRIVNEVEEEIKCHFLGSESLLDVVRDKLVRKNNSFVQIN